MTSVSALLIGLVTPTMLLILGVAVTGGGIGSPEILLWTVLTFGWLILWAVLRMRSGSSPR